MKHDYTAPCGAKKMRGFRSSKYGRFSCALTEDTLSFAGVQNLLKFQGASKSETLAVPDYLLPEAKQIMKRGTGDKMLNFARLCIVHEVALSACGE